MTPHNIEQGMWSISIASLSHSGTGQTTFTPAARYLVKGRDVWVKISDGLQIGDWWFSSDGVQVDLT